MTRTPTITVAIIAQNEAAHLASLLPQSAWADEVVVVDGGSHDATVEIARRSGAIVVVRPFDNFAAQRNTALAAAKSDWVLFVDADERPTPRLVDELRRRTADRTLNGYRVPIRSRILGRPFRFSGTQCDLPLRLLRRGYAEWQGAVHETCRVRGAVGRFDAHLRHETMPNLATFLNKVHRYTALEAMSRIERGESPRLRDLWLRPMMEFYRRLVWKQGWLDGPVGWKFAALSAYSEWTLALKHRRLWRQANHVRDARVSVRAVILPQLPVAGGVR